MAADEAGDSHDHDSHDHDSQARARALSLLEATHQFPCDYSVTVIALNRQEVTVAVRRAAIADGTERRGGVDSVDEEAEGSGSEQPPGLLEYQSRTSKEGKYLSHRFAVRVVQATEVLDLYARLRGVKGVVTLL